VIGKREILEMASALGLGPHMVEKDYVLGWILAGIAAHPKLNPLGLFKGGTSLKKCHFEATGIPRIWIYPSGQSAA